MRTFGPTLVSSSGLELWGVKFSQFLIVVPRRQWDYTESSDREDYEYIYAFFKDIYNHKKSKFLESLSRDS